MSHNDKEEAGAAVPAAQRSSWTSFVKGIAMFAGDLSSLTAPPFILSPVSLTEFPAYWAERPELFSAISNTTTEEARMLAVLRWFISTLKGQYTSRNDSMGSEKKPLNPVLGELFYGHWPDKNGRGETRLIVEQVSHHPPITAYHISNEFKKIILDGHAGQRTSFSGGAIIVKQEGHACLTVELPNGKKERFLITLPKLRIDGIWYGSPYIELSETSHIQSSSGWASVISYSGRGYFSGKTHSFKAHVTPPGSTTPKHTIEGQWHTTSKDSKGHTFHDVTGPKEEITVAPIEEQGQWESRRLWKLVAKGIREGDFDLASTEKGIIENEQRQRRKDESAAGVTWQLKHFAKTDGADCSELAHLAKVNLPWAAYKFIGNGGYVIGMFSHAVGSVFVPATTMMATNTLQIPDTSWSQTGSSPSPSSSSSKYSRPSSTAAVPQSSPSPVPSSSGRKRASHSVSSPSKDERDQGKENAPYWDVYSHPAAVAFAAAHPRRTIPKFGPYLLLQTLGEGEFGKVKLGLHNQWGEEVAVKLIRRGNVDNPLRLSKVEREIEVLKLLKHPNIVRLYEVIETDKYFGIILEYASGGELFDHILAHRYLKEKDACKLFAQLISGVSYIHSKKIVHRDLKLENLLLDRNRNVIITDFGFANRFEHRADDLMQTSCGSPCYAAPELVISEGLYVGSAVDIWSCGVILYAMLAGYLPFDDDPANPEGDNINLLYKYIVNTPLTFPDYITADARDLLSQMLVPDPKNRASLDSIKKHRWLEAYQHLFERSTVELERIAVEQQNVKRQAYQRQMRATAQQQTQAKEYLYDSSATSAPTPRRAVASAIVMGSNPEPEPFVDFVAVNDTLSPITSTSDHDRSSTRSKRSKSKEKRAKTPDKDGSRRKKTNQRHTLQLEYAEDVPASPQVPSPQRAPEAVVDIKLVTANSESTTVSSQATNETEDEPTTPKAYKSSFQASAQASPKTPTAAHPMPSSFEALFTPPSQYAQHQEQQQQQQHAMPQSNSNQSLPSEDHVAQTSQQSPQTTPRKPKGGDAASTNSGGSSGKRNRRGLSMDKFGFGVGKKASGSVTDTAGEEIIRNGVKNDDMLSSTSALVPAEKENLKVNGNDAKDAEQEKDDKKAKNRRKTLSLMVEPLSRTIKERKNRSVTVETNKPRDTSRVAKDTREKEKAKAKNNERAPTLTLTPMSAGGDTVKAAIPIDNIPEAPLSPPPGGVHNPTLPRALFNGSSTKAGVSTLTAKGVMNWFRLRSLGKKEPEILNDAQGGGGSDFVIVNPPTPSNVTASSASTTSRRTPSETSSAAPSAASRVASIMRTVTSPRFSQVSTPFVSATTVPANSSTSNVASTLRIHHGAVDQGTVTNGPPAVVFAHVTKVLQGMGLEMQREAEFKWRCVRPKKDKLLGGFDVVVGPGTAGSGGVDKRGLPVPSHLPSSAGGMLRGLLMRRTTSQTSSNPSLPLRQQQQQQAVSDNSGGTYEGEADSSLISDISMTMTSNSESAFYGDRNVDQGDEVRFSVELTRLDRLEDTLSLDIRRLKGNLRSYKFLYDTLRDRCAFVQ